MSTELLSDSATRARREELHKDRWTAFGEKNGIIEISEKPAAQALKKYDLFESYEDEFLEKISFDISIARWQKNTVLFEEGSYIDVAFFVVQGSVSIYFGNNEDGSALGEPIFDEPRTMILHDGHARRKLHTQSTHRKHAETVAKRDGQTMLSAIDFDLPASGIFRLGAGDIFGEIGALNGWPQSVSAKTNEECLLVQIRLPALRELKEHSKAFQKKIDAIYKERTLASQLQITPLFRNCGKAFLEALVEKVELKSLKPAKNLAKEGERADAVYLVRSGFLKLEKNYGDSSIVVTYLSKGMTFGEVELLIEDIDCWQYSASSVGHTELVKIAAADFLSLMRAQSEVEAAMWQSTVERIREAGFTEKHVEQAEFLEFSLEKGLVEGNSILLIDLETCTRCDDCVKACADTHGGRPRFIREGEKYQNYLVTRSCYHCRDPVCLVGCPTGAIRRANIGDVVEIDDAICIGCSQCARKCPYSAITMVDTGEVWPPDAIPVENRGQPRKVASKCDLCYASPAGPACVKNCPNGSAIRVGTMPEFQQLMAYK